MNTILLVDDEPWVRTGLRKTIEKTKLPLQVIHECEDGVEALEWLKANEVDLVLTDIRMPSMSGLLFARQVLWLNKKLDIVIISVHDDFQYAQEALRIGVFDYLLKPVCLNDMMHCLNKWLTSRKSGKSLQAGTEKPVSSHAPLNKVLNYIENAPPGSVSLSEAATLVNMNPSYLSQIFKQRMKVTFSDYITEMRINQGKELLTNSDLKIGQIAERLGYPDAAYFSNLFKKVLGQSPSDYRKQFFGGARADGTIELGQEA